MNNGKINRVKDTIFKYVGILACSIGLILLAIFIGNILIDGLIIYHPDYQNKPTNKPAISIPRTNIEFQFSPPFVKSIEIDKPLLDVHIIEQKFPLFQNLPKSEASNPNPQIDFDIVIKNIHGFRCSCNWHV